MRAKNRIKEHIKELKRTNTKHQYILHDVINYWKNQLELSK